MRTHDSKLVQLHGTVFHKECREDKQDQVSVLLNLGAKGRLSLLVPFLSYH